MKSYDMIVIGTGAGNIILEAAQAKGLRCAQIERGRFGGTCLNRGCIPTKVMVTAADQVYELRESGRIGLPVADYAIDWETITRRTWDRINLSLELRQGYLEDDSLDVYEGEGFFLDNHTLQVRYPDGSLSEPLTAPKIFIGVGGRTAVPDIEGLADVFYYTTEHFFGDAWPEAPLDRVIVVGGGAIGCEFAHVFRAFGAEVDIVQRNVRLLPRGDRELSAALLANLEDDGIRVHFNSISHAVRQEGDDIVLDIRDKDSGEITSLRSGALFICPGIRSNADSLHLEATDIAVDERGWIRTNEFLETSVEGVYAFGDVNGMQQMRHKANYEADILAHNHFNATSPEEWRWARYDLVPMVTYSHFETAEVGLSAEAAEARGHRIEVGYNHYADTAKGYALGFEKKDGAPYAFAKVVIDKDTDHILGAQAIGPFASVLIQPFLNLMSAGRVPPMPRNEDIASDEVKMLRARGLEHKLPPHKESTVRQTMVPHPSLSEVGIWTYYDMESHKLP